MPAPKSENLHEAAQIISQRLELDKKPRAQTAIVLGSGLGPFAGEN